jgi:competence protein ComEC
MFKLRYGYLFTGIITGLIVFFSFLWSLPDGKLHIVFCDVGQGDAAYIRLPDGRDVLIDGGPNEKIIGCLSRHMPFWDRRINIIVMTHPQNDHMGGLPAVFERYSADYFIRSDIDNPTQGMQKLKDVIREKHIPVKLVTTGERIDIGPANLTVLWPSAEQIASMHSSSSSDVSHLGNISNLQPSSILGSQAPSNLNDGSVVILLRYGTFDVLFPGDADSHVEAKYTKLQDLPSPVEVLKVPHHGSKIGMTKEFLDWLYPQPERISNCGYNNITIRQPAEQFNNCSLAVISVGKNSFGHPSKEAIDALTEIGVHILRTDEAGDIEVVSNGKYWYVDRK